MNSVVVVAVLTSVLVVMVDLHAVVDRVRQLNDAVERDVMVVQALQPVVVSHVVVVVAAAVAVVIYDFDLQPLVRHFVTMFDPLGFAGNCVAMYHRRVAE